MRLLTFIAMLVLGGLSLAAIATSETLNCSSAPIERIEAELGAADEI